MRKIIGDIASVLEDAWPVWTVALCVLWIWFFAFSAYAQSDQPFAPQLTIDDFKSQLGECVVLNIRFEKQVKYTEELQAKIRELEAKLKK